ncbi:hypothetical protein JTB14_017240 [Gonioctena quinquepunctata]|nr:hypothetical protein JTB14_017240 [Gonioctena quinquepunctata]
MMQLFTEFIASFAKSDKPTFGNIEWQPVNPESEMINVLKIISFEDITMEQFKTIGSKAFWNSLPILENDKLRD